MLNILHKIILNNVKRVINIFVLYNISNIFEVNIFTIVFILIRGTTF